MTRKRDKVANWFGLRSRSPKQKESHDDVPRMNLQAEIGAQAVGSSVDTRIGTATEPDAEPESDPEQDTNHRLQDRPQQPVWQMAWDSLPHSDRLLIETVVQDSDGSENIFSDLERIAHQRKQALHDRTWNDNNQLAGTDAVSVQVAISRIITCLRRFKEVGDIAVSFDPTHAALPWAAVRFVLEVCIASKLETPWYCYLPSPVGSDCQRRAARIAVFWARKSMFSWPPRQSLRTIVSLWVL
jgi:hypothetical protein